MTTTTVPTVCGYTEAQIIAAANYLPPGTAVALRVYEPRVRLHEVGTVISRADDPDSYLVEFPSRRGTCPVRLPFDRNQIERF